MKLTVIGDIHGRVLWDRIVVQESDSDLFIFLGDYFDSGRDQIPAAEQLANFDKIVSFKKQNPDKVILLFGNHDLHYLPGIEERYAGYQHNFAADISEKITSAMNEELLQLCYTNAVDDLGYLLFSHAGFTKTWCTNVLGIAEPGVAQLKVANDFLYYHPSVFKFSPPPGWKRSATGDDVTQPPVWVRPDSLFEDGIDGYIQIVGHTHTATPSVYKRGDRPYMVLADCLRYENYLVIENSEFLTRNVNQHYLETS